MQLTHGPFDLLTGQIRFRLGPKSLDFCNKKPIYVFSLLVGSPYKIRVHRKRIKTNILLNGSWLGRA